MLKLFFSYVDIPLFQADLSAGRVAFVGSAPLRIQEDYLRILRYFRFFARVASSAHAHEADTLAAIRDNARGMAGISGERVWGEWGKILRGRWAGEMTEEMVRVGLAPYIGLPKEPQVEEFARVYGRARERGERRRNVSLPDLVLVFVDGI